jgi:hypothetical protein
MRRFLALPDIPGYEGPMTIPADDPINICAPAIEGERLKDTYWRNREVQRLAMGTSSSPSTRESTASTSRSVQPALRTTLPNNSPTAEPDHIQSPQPIAMPQRESYRQILSFYNGYANPQQEDYRMEPRVLSPIEEVELSDMSQGEQHPAKPAQQEVSPLPVPGRRVRFVGLEEGESYPEEDGNSTHVQGSSPIKEDEYEDEDGIAAEDFERWVDLCRQDQESSSETSQMAETDSGSTLIKREAHHNWEENMDSILKPKPLTLRKANSLSESSSSYSRNRSNSLTDDAGHLNENNDNQNLPSSSPHTPEGGGEGELDWPHLQSAFGDNSIPHTPRLFRSTSAPMTTSTKHRFDEELARRREMYRRASKEYFAKEMQRMREEASTASHCAEAKTEAETPDPPTKNENSTEEEDTIDLSLPIQNFDDTEVEEEEEEESLVDLRTSIFRDSRIPNRFVSAHQTEV